jgi:hypothetical protein
MGKWNKRSSNGQSGWMQKWIEPKAKLLHSRHLSVDQPLSTISTLLPLTMTTICLLPHQTFITDNSANPLSTKHFNPAGTHLTDSILNSTIDIIITVFITLQNHHLSIDRNQATAYLVSPARPPTAIALPSAGSLPLHPPIHINKLAKHREQCSTKKLWRPEWSKCLFTPKAGMDIDTMQEGRPHLVRSFIPETQSPLNAADPTPLLALAINAADLSSVLAATLIGNQ